MWIRGVSRALKFLAQKQNAQTQILFVISPTEHVERSDLCCYVTVEKAMHLPLSISSRPYYLVCPGCEIMSFETSGPQYWYPLHESVRHRLDPEYVEFYERYLISLPQVQDQPISVSRAASPIVAGGSKPLPVGRRHDLLVDRKCTSGPQVRVRAFFPEGEPPSVHGWPAVLYFHGGGFVFGSLDTENTICSHMCARARCVVLTVDYRLAPENPFPAPLDDCWEAFLWMIGEGVKFLDIDSRKTAIGGASAGANLAAVIAQRALSIPKEVHRFVSQLLVVPVIDQTATIHNNPTWEALRFTASLTAEKMTWYRRHYLPREEDWASPGASPLMSTHETLSRLPPTLILVAELDILKHEGEQYARKLREAGTPVDIRVIPGVPHPYIAMDGVLSVARESISLLCETLSSAFGERENGRTS